MEASASIEIVDATAPNALPLPQSSQGSGARASPGSLGGVHWRGCDRRGLNGNNEGSGVLYRGRSVGTRRQYQGEWAGEQCVEADDLRARHPRRPAARCLTPCSPDSAVINALPQLGYGSTWSRGAGLAL